MPATNSCRVEAYLELAEGTDIETFLDEVTFYESVCTCRGCQQGYEHVMTDAEVEAMLP